MSGDRIQLPRPTTVVALGGLTSDRAICGQEDGGVSLINLSAGAVLETVAGPGSVSALALSSDGILMVRGAGTGVLEAWSFETKLCIAHLRGHSDGITDLDVDWSGQRLASASRDGTVKLWDLTSGTCIKTLRVSADKPVTQVSVDWEHHRVLCSSDELLHLFDTESGEQLATLEGHSDPIELLTVDWAGMRALSVSGGNSVKVWELQSRERILSFLTDQKFRLLGALVDWAEMIAIAIFDDGRSQLWDLASDDDASSVKWLHAAPKFSNFTKQLKQIDIGA